MVIKNENKMKYLSVSYDETKICTPIFKKLTKTFLNYLQGI